MPNSRNYQRKGYAATRSFLRLLKKPRGERGARKPSGVKVAFIHGDKRLTTGASHINQLMAGALKARGARVRSFYPRVKLTGAPAHLRGIANILFFHSLLEHKHEILKFNVIQGTTYTPLPFLTFNIPVVSHFGSTVQGFLESVPKTAKLPMIEREVYRELYSLGVIPEFDYKTFRPLEDTADMEALVATQATACIATSQKVRAELQGMGVEPERIRVIHNAIEDYWFDTAPPAEPQPPHIVFLGRLGGDVFTLKLKGFSRLVGLYRMFPRVQKTTVCMTESVKLKEWMRSAFENHQMFVNLRKDLIPGALSRLYGSVLFMPSRYEGFSLSLVEGMSQGLVPVSYPVGVAPEVIRNGENGFLVSSREEAQARVGELLENTEARLKMAAAARESAKAFRSAQIADELLALYKDVRKEYPYQPLS